MQQAYRAEIDGLRAIAVIAVILNHIHKPLLPSGYLGVDIFFVISGYVITSSLASRKSANFSSFIFSFYQRRIQRLLPALAVFVVITGLLICLFNPDPKLSLGLGKRALVGISNITLYNHSTDYFSAPTELLPYTHTWSLGVEEQFYLLFPLLVWTTGFARQTRSGAFFLAWTVGALSLASLLSFLWLYPINQPAAYFLMPNRFWEMGAGCLIYLILKNRSQIQQWILQLPALPVALAALLVLSLPQSMGQLATPAIVALSAILIACLQPKSLIYRFLKHRSLVHLGLISYSLYLWHWGVLSISRWTIGIHWWSLPFQVSLMLILAQASYTYVETPLRSKPWFQHAWFTPLAGAGVMTAGVAVLSGINFAAAKSLYQGKAIDVAAYNLGTHGSSCNIFENWNNSLSLSSSCGYSSNSQQPSKAKQTIYLVGDSHAEQFNATFQAYGQMKGFNVKTIWGNSCMFPASVVSNSGVQCYERQRALETALYEKIRANDVVVIANSLFIRFPVRLDHQESYSNLSGEVLSISTAASTYSRDLRRVAESLISRGAKVVIYLDPPQFSELKIPGYLCTSEWYRPAFSLSNRCLASRRSHAAHASQFFGWTTAWQDNKYRFVWNAANDANCDGDRCSAANYIDGNHLAKHYVRELFDRYRRSSPSPFPL